MEPVIEKALPPILKPIDALLSVNVDDSPFSTPSALIARFDGLTGAVRFYNFFDDAEVAQFELSSAELDALYAARTGISSTVKPTFS
jgi:hypothetical protein